ncbi:MAG TPA: polysaccharide deacetylase family protein [Burkholderiaceae bacterium]|nr:polysaccharide deacetylase family protein [Burkholderiaceae bacterium]
MRRVHHLILIPALALAAALPAAAVTSSAPVELHDRIALDGKTDRRIALTLDACGGGYDAELIDFLILHRIPATVFATGRWIERNPVGLAVLKSHADLFGIEDHGEHHRAAVIGAGRRIYGIPGVADIGQLRGEVTGGADAIEQAFGTRPRWYRGATAEYDPQAASEIRRMGFRIAGFSVNADAGATLSANSVSARVRRAQPGDVILAHMNKPSSDTNEGLRPALLELRARGLQFVRLDDVELSSLP